MFFAKRSLANREEVAAGEASVGIIVKSPVFRPSSKDTIRAAFSGILEADFARRIE